MVNPAVVSLCESSVGEEEKRDRSCCGQEGNGRKDRVEASCAGGIIEVFDETRLMSDDGAPVVLALAERKWTWSSPDH